MAIINPLDFQGKTILVTGASSGIGRETAVFLSQLGAKLILVARRNDELLKTKEMLHGDGHMIEPFDLNDFDAVPIWLKNISQKSGLISGLVHSAGMALINPLRFLNSKQLNEIFSLNVNSAFAIAKAFRQKGVCQTSASIVFLSSAAGIVGQSGLSAYSASKGAIISLTKALAIELARENIRVNCVAPAVVQTEMVEKSHSNFTEEQQKEILAMSPLGIGTTKDVANSIVFLLSDMARWITGTTLVVDGGYTAH